MTIETIKERDIQQVLDIYNWYIENTTITFEIEKLTFESFCDRVHMIIKKYPFFVCREEDKVIGYGYLSYFNERAAYDITADLSIYFDHDYLARGYGSLLYKKLEAWAVKNSILNIISLITEENKNSLRFHEKMGFKECGYLENVGIKFERKLGVYFYIKAL